MKIKTHTNTQKNYTVANISPVYLLEVKKTKNEITQNIELFNI